MITSCTFERRTLFRCAIFKRVYMQLRRKAGASTQTSTRCASAVSRQKWKIFFYPFRQVACIRFCRACWLH